MKKKITIGRKDIVDLPDFKLFDVKAKIDTGAYTSSINCSLVKIIHEDGAPTLEFHIPGKSLKGKHRKIFKTKKFTRKNIRSSNGHIEKRYIITTKILLFNKLIRTEFSLTDRSTMRYPLLLGRKLLINRFIVDVGEKDLSFQQKQEKIRNENSSIIQE